MLKGPFLSKDFIGANENYETSKIVMLGMPYDCTCSNRPGTRFAPQAMRLESIGIETYSVYFDSQMEDLNFYDIKLSLKSSDVLTTIKAYQEVAKIIDYPLHLGVTEAGTLKSGLIKSSIGLGTLLSQGIGDTIRVSLTENPVEEVEAGYGILKSLDLRKRGVNFISCPTCGRTQIDLISLAKKVEEKFKNLDLPITIAVMGCPVNGPGEAKHADFGIAGAIKEGYIFKKGEIIARVPESDLINSLEKIIMETYSSDK